MASSLQRQKRKEAQRSQLAQRDAKELERLVDQRVELRMASVIQQVEHYSGPIPRHDHCAEYEKLLPGFTNRVLTITEKAQDAEITGTRRRDLFEGASRIMGISAAFLICSGIISGGFYLLLNDKAAPGWFMMIGGLATLAGAFIIKPKMNSGNNH